MIKYLILFSIAILTVIVSFIIPIQASNSSLSVQGDNQAFVISNKSTDSLMLDSLLILTGELRFTQPSLALQHAENALHVAMKLESKSSISKVLTDIGYIHWRLGNYSQAIDKIDEAKRICYDLNDMLCIARASNILGAIYQDKGFYNKALKHLFLALSIFEEIDSISRTAAIFNNIALIYQDKSDLEKAEEFHKRSLNIKKAFKNERGIAFSLNNLGSISKQRGNYHEALVLFDSSLVIRRKYNDTRGIANTQQNIGYLYIKKGQPEEALRILNNTRELYEQLEDPAEKARIDNLLAKAYYMMGSFAQAKHFFKQSLEAANRIGLPVLVIKNYSGMSDLAVAEFNYQEATKYLQKQLVLTDSLYDAESRQRILDLQMIYDRESEAREIDIILKDNQITKLNIEKQKLVRNFLLVFITLITIMLLITIYRYSEYKKTNKLLQDQKNEILQYNQMLKNLNKGLLAKQEKVEELNKKLVESEKNLIEINKTKDHFFSIISHDLRSPFASIVSFSRIIKRDIDNLSKEELQELTNELDKSVIKINNLLDNLLQWSRSQTGKIRYKPNYFNLKEIITDNLNLFSSNAKDKNIELKEYVDEGIEAWADIDMCDTIIRNLLSNALKYTHSKGKIGIGASVAGDMVEVSVTDTGIGISESDQEKLFRIDKLHSTFGTNDEKGSGLGLLLCKEFVEKQGGKMSLTSSPGKGSTFSFTIPIKQPE